MIIGTHGGNSVGQPGRGIGRGGDNIGSPRLEGLYELKERIENRCEP